MGIQVVCEFLPREFKEKLVEIATLEDLAQAGYSQNSIYKIKEKKIISDEKCEKLVQVLGDRVKNVLVEALNEFATQLIKLGITVSSSPIDCSKINSKLDEILQLLKTNKKS
uniref:Uncharacterized protein n=1 Tax=Saccharolobus islandicus TaxID=43080 RepID=Q9HH86_SACIS|nr:hypothetical protein [Sulfolobus islandicus]